MLPTLGNGKICYLEIPATDIARSAEFYEQSFGWDIRKRGDDLGFAVSVHGANQEAARVVTAIASGCGWLPGGAEWIVP